MGSRTDSTVLRLAAGLGEPSPVGPATRANAGAKFSARRHALAGVGAKRGIPESAGGGVRVTDLRFGQEAPGFSLPSSAGGQTALSDFKGKSDVVLVFYCYDWGSI